MASIKISELRPVGSELFHDSESFLDELNEREMLVSGGTDGSNLYVGVISQKTISIGVSIVSLSVVTQVKKS
jgi:hypothetical protein